MAVVSCSHVAGTSSKWQLIALASLSTMCWMHQAEAEGLASGLSQPMLTAVIKANAAAHGACIRVMLQSITHVGKNSLLQ